MKSTITRLATSTTNSGDKGSVTVKQGGASLGVAKGVTGGGASSGAAKQLPGNVDPKNKIGGRAENTSNTKSPNQAIEHGPRKKITVNFGQPSAGHRDSRNKSSSSVVSGGNSPIFDDQRNSLSEQEAKNPGVEKSPEDTQSKKDNDNLSGETGINSGGVISFSLKNRPSVLGTSAEGFKKEHADSTKFKSTFSEASSEGKTSSTETKLRNSLDSFIKVQNKDETMELDWPREMIKFTSTEPSISYSCNPLVFDFSDLLGKPSKVKNELDIVSAKIESVSSEIEKQESLNVDGDEEGMDEEGKDEEVRTEAMDIRTEEVEKEQVDEKVKKHHKRKKKKHRHKERGGDGEEKEESKKSEKKKKKKKRKKKHKRSDKEKGEAKEEKKENEVDMKDADQSGNVKSDSKVKVKVNNDSDGETGDVEDSDAEDGKHKKNKHKKRRKKKSKKKKRRHHDSEAENKDSSKVDEKKMEVKSSEKIKKEVKGEKDYSSGGEIEKMNDQNLMKVEKEFPTEKNETNVKVKTESDNKRKYFSDNSESNDENSTKLGKPKILEEPVKQSSRSPAFASEKQVKKLKREGSGSDRRNSSLRKRQTSESSVSEATPVKKQKVTPRLIAEPDVKVQDTWSKMEGLYEAKIPENPKSKWDTSDSDMESHLDKTIDQAQKRKVLKKSIASQKKEEVIPPAQFKEKNHSAKPAKSKKSDKKERESSESRSRSRSRGHTKKKKHRSYSRSYSRSKSRSRGRSYSSSSYSSRSRSRSYSRSYSRSRSRSHRRYHSRSDSYSSYSDYSRSRSRSSRSHSYSSRSRSRSHSRRYSSYSRSRSRSSSYSRSRSRSRSYHRSHRRSYSSRSRSSSYHSAASHSDKKKKRYRTKKITSANEEKKDISLDIPLPTVDDEKPPENLAKKIMDKKHKNNDLVKKGLEEAEKGNKNIPEGKDYFDIPLPTAEQVKSETSVSMPPPPPPPGQKDMGHYSCPPSQYGGYGPHHYDDMMGPMHHSMRYPPPPHGMRMPPPPHRMPPPGMYRGRGPPPHHDMRYGPPPPHMMNGPRGMPPHMHDGYHPRGGYPYRFPPPNMNRDDKPPLPPSRSPSPQPQPPEEKAAEEIQPNPSIVIPPEQAEQYKRLQEQAQKHAGKQLKRLKKMEAGEPYSESSSSEEEEEEKQEEQSNDGTEDLAGADDIQQTLVAIPSPSLAVPQQQTILISNPQAAAGGLTLVPQIVPAAGTPQHILVPQGMGLSTALALNQAGHPLQAGAPMIAMPQSSSISALAAAAAAGAQPAHLPGTISHPMLTQLGAQPTLMPATHPLLAQSMPGLSALPQTQLISGAALAGLQSPSPVIVGNHILVPRIVRPAI